MLADALKRSALQMRPVLKATTAFLAASVIACTMSATVSAADEPATSGGPTSFRRLNEAQYKRSIEAIFGSGLKVPGRFEPPLRDDGLLAVGESKVVITPSGLEQYDLRAREIAAQVMAEDRRKTILQCAPPAATAYDDACARQFLGKYGRLLYRRPLADDEMTSLLGVTRAATDKTGDFYKGLQFSLTRLLVSPNFLFRVETTEAGANSATVQHLDDYSLASRVSFLLWDAPPDDALLDAAAKGDLHDPKGLNRQIDRMIASPRFEDGVRAFFSDMFVYDQFDNISKDASIYPLFSSQLIRDAEEQSLRTIVDLLVTHKGDYRDLFTTRKTFINRNLGALYQVQVDDAGFGGGWMPYTFGSEEHRAGILTLAAFLMQDPDDSHEGKTSPTVRGKSLREALLCQKVPAPPGNVDFSKFQDPKNPFRTARERLTAHRDNPTCAGCHSITDPIGLAAENYDAVGDYRTMENGTPIDASGTFEGKSYKTVIELEKIFHDSPSATNCVAERAYEYGVGRTVAPGEHDWLKYLEQKFAGDHYEFPALMRDIATSNAFHAVSVSNLASN